MPQRACGQEPANPLLLADFALKEYARLSAQAEDTISNLCILADDPEAERIRLGEARTERAKLCAQRTDLLRWASDMPSYVDSGRLLITSEEEISNLDACQSGHAPAYPYRDFAYFPDIPDNHRVYEDIARLKKEGVLIGYPDGLYRGNRIDSVNEIAAVIIQSGVHYEEIIDGITSGQGYEGNTAEDFQEYVRSMAGLPDAGEKLGDLARLFRYYLPPWLLNDEFIACEQLHACQLSDWLESNGIEPEKPRVRHR